MRVLVCGGRDFNDKEKLFKALDNLAKERSICYTGDDNWLATDFVILSGGATGADTLAVDWASHNWVTVKEYKADWKTHGRAAGPFRNQQMIDDGKPDIVVAFPGGKGTADMVARARKAGIEVVEIE